MGMATAAAAAAPVGVAATTLRPSLSFVSSKPQNPYPRNPKRSSSLVRFSSSSSSSSSPSLPETDCPVPLEQQPLNEYQALASSFPFSWAAADLRHYSSRLLFTGASFALFVGLPVAAFGVVDLDKEALKCGLGALSAGLLAVTFAVLRIYLGWAYVGNRLLSATVEYEETGWYDGQIWVKTPEVLARDRLLGSFTVKPVLSRVKLTLVGLAVSLVVCASLFFILESPKGSSYISSKEAGGRAIPGVYNDNSARSFEPDAFCGEPELP